MSHTFADVRSAGKLAAFRVGPRRRALLACLLILVTILTLSQRLRPTGAAFNDFKPLHLATQCLVHHCDPYDAAALNREGTLRNEAMSRPIHPEAPVYPPSALLLVAPLEPLGWPAAGLVFTLASGVVALLACISLFRAFELDRSPPAFLLLLSFLLAVPLSDTLQFGNPALLVTALTSIAGSLLLRETSGAAAFRPGWFALGLALALKPQVAIGATLFLLWNKNTRSAAARSLAVFALLLAAGSAWGTVRLGSFHFLAQPFANMHLALTPGHTADPSPGNEESFSFLNLQPFFLRIPGLSPLSATLLTCAVTGSFLLFACIQQARQQVLRQRPWTVLALCVLLSLFIPYHREYDRVLVLLLIPAAAELCLHKHPLTWPVTFAALAWMLSDVFFHHILRRWQFQPWTAPIELVLCVLLLVSLHPVALASRTPRSRVLASS